MISVIEVTPTTEIPKPRAKARPARITTEEMLERMAKVRAAKDAKNAAMFKCSKCKRKFESQHGLNVHTARPGRFHMMQVNAAKNRKLSVGNSSELANLQSKWMSLAINSQGPVREALMECVIDLRLALRG